MLWWTKPPHQFHKQLVHLCLLKFLSLENLGGSSLVKSGKLYPTFRFPPVFGSCNSKILLLTSCDNMDPFWKIYDWLSPKLQEIFSIITFLFFWLFSQNVTRDIFCNNSFDVKTIKFNRFHNRKTFLFHVSFKLVWLKGEIKNIYPH